MPNTTVLRLRPVTARPVFYPQLGAFFRALRTQRRLGFRQAVNVAQTKGLSAITRQALFGLEKGQTKNADPDVLRAIAKLYEVDYAWVVTNFVGHRYGLNQEAGKDLMRVTEDFEQRLLATSGGIAEKDRRVLERLKALDEDDFNILMTMLKQLEQKRRKGAQRRLAKKRRVA